MPNNIFLIDHHCKTQSELTDMLKNTSNLLDFLHGGSGSEVVGGWGPVNVLQNITRCSIGMRLGN